MKQLKSEQKHEQTIKFSSEDFLKALGIDFLGKVDNISMNGWHTNEHVELTVTTIEVDRLKQIEYDKVVDDPGEDNNPAL